MFESENQKCILFVSILILTSCFSQQEKLQLTCFPHHQIIAYFLVILLSNVSLICITFPYAAILKRFPLKPTHSSPMRFMEP